MISEPALTGIPDTATAAKLMGLFQALTLGMGARAGMDWGVELEAADCCWLMEARV